METICVLTWKSCLKLLRKVNMGAVGLAAICLISVPASLFAQTDEIQVYDADIAPQGIFNIMVHSNFTPEGRTTPAYPGAIIANHSFNGAWEWAYGVKPWMEQGLYMPVYSPYSTGRGGAIDGFKIRELFVRPHAQQHKALLGHEFRIQLQLPLLGVTDAYGRDTADHRRLPR